MINDEELSVSKEDHTLHVESFPKLKNADFRTNSFSVSFPYIGRDDYLASLTQVGYKNYRYFYLFL